MKFQTLGLAEPLLRAVAAEGYDTPTPIQSKAIPHVLEGRDLLGCAQTGTGKTAAFALPILHRLTAHAKPGVPAAADLRHAAGAPAAHSAGAHAAADHGRHDPHAPRAGAHSHSQRSHARTPAHQQPSRASTAAQNKARVLVLAPTRELAIQIAESFETYGRHTNLYHAVIFGGVRQGPQVSALRRGVDIIVATPGRLLDLMEQGYVDLSAVEIFVLDEADRMLDMGFILPIRKIVAKMPTRRQTLMFSATMPPEIRRLADTILRDPVSVEVTPVASTTELVEQSVYFVDRKNKPALLTQVLRASPAHDRTLVFTRTKHGADRVARDLVNAGIPAEAIHGNKRQNVRQQTLEKFRSGHTPVLVATDIAARGIDIDDIRLVVNYDLPNIPETYVHRIGRTGRAGASGHATAFCDHEERAFLKDIERLVRQRIPVLGAGPAEDQRHGPAQAQHRQPRTGRGVIPAKHAPHPAPAPHKPAKPDSHKAAHAGHTPRASHPAPKQHHGAKPHGHKPHHTGPAANSNRAVEVKPAHKPHGQPHSKPHAQSHSKPHAASASAQHSHSSRGTHAGHAAKHAAPRRNFRGGHIGGKS